MDSIKQLIASNLQQLRTAVPAHRSPVLSVRLSGRTGYHFSETDLRRVFTVFGTVTRVTVQEHSAEVHFEDLPAAFVAHQCLNGKYLNTLQASLVLEWAVPQAG